MPWKMTLPFTISPMMHPTDQISTEESERHRNIKQHNHCIAEPRLVHSRHRVRAFSQAADTTLSSRRAPDCLPNAPLHLLLVLLGASRPFCPSLRSSAYQFTQLLLSSTLSHRARKEQQGVEPLSPLWKWLLVERGRVTNTH